MNHIGTLIKDLVNSKKLTKREFAKLISKSEQYVYDIYNNEHIHTKLLLEIANILEVDIIYFFKESNQVNEEQAVYKTKQTGTHVFNGINNGSINITHENEMLKQKVQDLEDKLKLKDQIITLLEPKK